MLVEEALPIACEDTSEAIIDVITEKLRGHFEGVHPRIFTSGVTPDGAQYHFHDGIEQGDAWYNLPDERYDRYLRSNDDRFIPIDSLVKGTFGDECTQQQWYQVTHGHVASAMISNRNIYLSVGKAWRYPCAVKCDPLWSTKKKKRCHPLRSRFKGISWGEIKCERKVKHEAKKPRVDAEAEKLRRTKRSSWLSFVVKTLIMLILMTLPATANSTSGLPIDEHDEKNLFTGAPTGLCIHEDSNEMLRGSSNGPSYPNIITTSETNRPLIPHPRYAPKLILQKIVMIGGIGYAIKRFWLNVRCRRAIFCGVFYERRLHDRYTTKH